VLKKEQSKKMYAFVWSKEKKKKKILIKEKG